MATPPLPASTPTLALTFRMHLMQRVPHWAVWQAAPSMPRSPTMTAMVRGLPCLNASTGRRWLRLRRETRFGIPQPRGVHAGPPLLGQPVSTGTSPTPAQVVRARTKAGLTQAEAAALVWCSEITWRQWEKYADVPGARRMHPCFWWAFQQRVKASGRGAGGAAG